LTAVNLICSNGGGTLWKPTAIEIGQIVLEAGGLATALMVQRQGAAAKGHPVPYPFLTLGGAGGAAPLLPGVAAAAAMVMPAWPAGLGLPPAAGVGGAPASSGGPAAPGVAPGLVLPEGIPHADALEALRQTLAAFVTTSPEKAKKKKRKSKGRKRSRSGSDSSSSSTSSVESGKYIQWEPVKRARGRLSSSALAKVESLRFKRRSDLVNFSTRFPGALAGQFLCQVRARMSQDVAECKDLHRTDVGPWSQREGLSGLKEVRDQREVQLLSKAVTLMNQQKWPEVQDLLCQRIREVTQANRAGGTWEKAELLSLLPTSQASTTPLPDGCLNL
jgi:hypothetical protein